MSWAERNRDQIDKMRAYALQFSGRRPFILDCFEGGARPVFPLAPESDRGTALLLVFAALRQNVSEDRLVAFLAHLWNAYGPDIFRLNHLPFAELEARVKAFPGLRDWPLRLKAPGILRSLCDFFYRRGRIESWVRSVGDGEECARLLAEEIFLMGKTSELRLKARYFVWLLTQLPGSEPGTFWKEDAVLCPTPGHGRFLREFGPLQGGRRGSWSTPLEKLGYYNRFYRLLFPGRTYLAFTGLDLCLKPDPDERWACRKALGGCHNCALVASCSQREI